MKVVLGVCGGIAAYKACSLLRLFAEAGDDVTVVPTKAALRFVGAATWEALSGKPAPSEVWGGVHNVPHVLLGRTADLLVVAPATADLLARAAHGLADDLLTNTLLTARCPVVLAPAMHTEMWQHPATVASVATLRSRGVHVIEPASGRLTGADSGPGRLPEPDEIYAVCRELASAAPVADSARRVAAPTDAGAAADTGGVADAVTQAGPLAGRHVVVSAGGTREPLDPVRYLGNRSSGKQGYALARVAAARGARVTLVSANVEFCDPAGVEVVRVGTACELQAAVAAVTGVSSETGPLVDAVVMAAAVADFRPASYAPSKIKRTHRRGARDELTDAPSMTLVHNPDILAELVQQRAGSPLPVLVGFAAETGDDAHSVVELAREKLLRKGCDLIVANQVGTDLVFGHDGTAASLLSRRADGEVDVVHTGPLPKEAVAALVWDAVQERLSRS